MKMKNSDVIDSYDYLSHAVSSQDCTGLIPIPPLTSEDEEHYREIYPYLPSRTDEPPVD